MDITDLQNAVEHLHDCHATFREIVEVLEEYNGEPVWEGEVSVFQITGHPDADTCYAWGSPTDEEPFVKYYAVLKLPPIETPLDAVRASIVHDYRSK